MSERAPYNDPHPGMGHVRLAGPERLLLYGDSAMNQSGWLVWTGTPNLAQWALLLDFLAPRPRSWWRRAWDRLASAVRP